MRRDLAKGVKSRMSRIVSLRRSEPATLDTGVLLRLEAALGLERSREVLAEACCAIIEKLTRFDLADDPAEARRLARSIAALSDEVGMDALGRAARAAAVCAAGDDPAARAATAARMLRLGETSLDRLLSSQTAG